MNSSLQLLLTLLGVTFLFGCAQANGTMERMVGQTLRLCHGRSGLLPLVFFLLAAAAAMVGPGSILSTALVAPFAMRAGIRAGLTPFLISLMVGNGAIAGNMSPFSTTGAIASALMTRAGLAGHEFRVWCFDAAAHTLVALVAYFALSGFKSRQPSTVISGPPQSLDRHQLATVIVLAGWIAVVMVLRWPLGLSAFCAGMLLVIARITPPRRIFRHIPWRVIAMVVTISALIGAVERAGGLVWFGDFLSRVATPRSVYAVIAFITGVISTYSSTSAVVLPAFLPLAPSLAERFAGVDSVALSISIVVGSGLVDVSPLSTVGALCIAAVPEGAGAGLLFRKLLAWGVLMAPVAAAMCYFASSIFTVH